MLWVWLQQFEIEKEFIGFTLSKFFAAKNQKLSRYNLYDVVKFISQNRTNQLLQIQTQNKNAAQRNTNSKTNKLLHLCSLSKFSDYEKIFG